VQAKFTTDDDLGYIMRNCLFYLGPSGPFFELSGPQTFKVEHCTIWATGGTPTVMLISHYSTTPLIPRFVFRDNIVWGNSTYEWNYPVQGDWTGAGPTPWTNLCSDTYAGTYSFVITHNVIPSGTLWSVDDTPGAGWPKPASTYHNDVSVTVAQMESDHFENVATGNFRLKSASKFKDTASDETDPGCDIDALYAAFSPDDLEWVADNYPGIVPA
jgi:hypothetical protein